MSSSAAAPLFEEFLVTAEAVALARPEVDPELAREVFGEAATLLHNGLALDGLDDHDLASVIAGLCVDLVAEDPGAAVRARSRASADDPRGLHDPAAVSAAYLIAAASCNSDDRTEAVAGPARSAPTGRRVGCVSCGTGLGSCEGLASAAG